MPPTCLSSDVSRNWLELNHTTRVSSSSPTASVTAAPTMVEPDTSPSSFASVSAL